ncbi:MAG: UDP-N-acetylglucosamine 2-epimerase [Bacilli bacterium]|nr:UDP-N-acetylglucosamine 2-epimerase [Bacilli bacterium]
MIKIMTIVGARPQFIKAAAVSRELRKHFTEILVDTGQHYDYKMAGIFFEELDIPQPEYQLGVGSGTHGFQTGAMLQVLEQVMLQEQPEAILVYGDTNSTLAGALAASKLNIPLFHIESGLRSFNRRMPEEVNRILTDQVSDLLFAPTKTAVENLYREGIIEHVYAHGDVMYDAVLYYLRKAEEQFSLEAFEVEQKQYILATLHRAENTDDTMRLEAIVHSLVQLDQIVLMPIHPRTKKMLQQLGMFEFLQQAPNIRIIEPVSYLEMLLLEQHAYAIITDSGGVQKEAYFAGVPCFTLRNETEWVETVELGWNRLVNPQQESLKEAIYHFVIPVKRPMIYGEGDASKRMVEQMRQWFKQERGMERERVVMYG